jgi:hypothetical protein
MSYPQLYAIAAQSRNPELPGALVRLVSSSEEEIERRLQTGEPLLVEGVTGPDWEEVHERLREVVATVRHFGEEPLFYVIYKGDDELGEPNERTRVSEEVFNNGLARWVSIANSPAVDL